MDTKEAIGRIRAALVEVAASGQQFVSVPLLQQFLSGLERDAPAETEVRKLQQESNLALLRAHHEANLAMLRSVLESAKAALTSSILVNGGATIALLAYLGSVAAKSPPSAASPSIVLALTSFAFGVLAGAVASGTGYATQYCYHWQWQRSGVGFHIASVVLVVASYVLFAAGVVAAYHAFL